MISSLLGIYAGLVNLSDLEARKALQLNWLTSHRYWWDIKCEADPDTSSLSFFETLRTIPTYFELHDQETQQPAFGFVLDDTKSDEVDFFSFRQRGLAPAVAKTRIQSDQVAIILYEIFVGMVLMCHVLTKPRIKGTKAELNKQRRKLYLIWTPILIIALLA